MEACVLALAANPCDLAGTLAGSCKPLVDTAAQVEAERSAST
jgi:hypothetical protein